MVLVESGYDGILTFHLPIRLNFDEGAQPWGHGIGYRLDAVSVLHSSDGFCIPRQTRINLRLDVNRAILRLKFVQSMVNCSMLRRQLSYFLYSGLRLESIH